jgi:membrane-associated protease RseP (regulator of RpoE activity)
MAFELVNQRDEGTADTVEVPASTPWPIVLAFGITMLFAGLVTSEAVSVLGAAVAIAGAVGWFRDVLPYEAHETVRVAPQVPAVTTMRHEVARMEIEHELRRAWLPVEIYPISAGIKGGLAGSVAMAVMAMLYGVLSQTSIWYPINLLAAGFFPATANTAEIAAFHLRALLIAIPIHLITSLLVGLLYGAMLPMLPRRPILLGGFIAPLLWSGLIHSILGIVNPVLNQRIDWLWFVASQVGFGIVAGLVVSRQERIRTRQHLPLALRVGLEASGMREDESG